VRKIEGKLDENEENIGLNDKKAYEDQFIVFDSTRFYQCSFGALSLFSLSRTLAHLKKSKSIVGAFLEHSSFHLIGE